MVETHDIRRLLAVLGLFAAVTLALCGAIRQGTLFEGVPEVKAKMDGFTSRKDEFDLVFVGSSLVRSQIDPAQFDQALASNGVALKSFNFGISDMTPPESFYVVEQLLRLKPAHLRFVVLELLPVRVRADDDSWKTSKFTYWHDLRTSAQVIRLVTASAAPLEVRLKSSLGHVLAWAEGWFGLSKGRVLIEGMAGYRGGEVEDYLGPAANGFISYDEYCRRGRTDVRALVDRFHAHHDAYLARLARCVDGSDRPVWSLTPPEAAAFGSLQRKAARQGVSIVYVLLPRLEDSSRLIAAVGSSGAHVLDRSTPQSHPELFAVGNKADDLHLNEQGARLLTAGLAQDFDGWLRAGCPGSTEPHATDR